MELVMLILSTLNLIVNIIGVVVATKTLQYTKEAATITGSDGFGVTK